MTSTILFPIQVDIGQGWKEPGYYVQRSCGLFPAPHPQNSQEIDRLSKLFELLGIFIAKCIQDKRRVDLPLARPFFKLMSSYTVRHDPLEDWGEQGEGGGMTGSRSESVGGEQQSENNQQLVAEDDCDDSRNYSRVQNQQETTANTDQLNSRGNQNENFLQTGVSLDGGAATSSKETELQMLVTREEDEITKDRGAEKEELLVLEELGEGSVGGGDGERREQLEEAPWYQGILQMEDLQEVNPHRYIHTLATA